MNHKPIAPIAVAVSLTMTQLAYAWGSAPPETPSPSRLAYSGHVEVSPGAAAAECKVVLDGTPLGATCDANGNFVIRGVPSGTWTFRVTVPGLAPLLRLVVGDTGKAGQPPVTFNLSTFVMGPAGSVVGRIVLGTAAATDAVAVVFPGTGAVAQPTAQGYFLLQNVAPGSREIVLVLANGTQHKKTVAVLAGMPTTGVDFDLRPVVVIMPDTGTVRRP